MAFDPWTDIPTTEEEVMIALQREGDVLLTNILQGLYRTRRGQGEGLLEAYQGTLEDHVRAAGYDIGDFIENLTESPD